MRLSDLERRAAEAAARGDLARAAGLLERVVDSAHPWRLRTLTRVYQRLTRLAPDPRTRLRLDAESTEGFWQDAWERARRATNAAWRAYETADDLAKLRRALADVRAYLAIWPHLIALRETEARLLVRLGRDEEAFAVVRCVEEIVPDRTELADLRGSAAYQAWAGAQPRRAA